MLNSRSAEAAKRLRARNVDRTTVRNALDAAYSDGQLTDVEHRHRTEAASSARTLDDLDRLVRDLQAPPDLRAAVTAAPPAASTRRIVAVAAAVVVVCGIVVAISSRDHHAATTRTTGETQLTTAAGFGRMLDEIQRQLGTSEIDSLTVYPDYAMITRPVRDKPGLQQRHQYKHGELSDNGTSSNRTEGVAVDLAELRPNVPELIALFYGADRTLGVSDPTSAYLTAERDDDDGPVVSIYLRNEDTGAQGFMTVGFDGVVRSVYRADQ